MLPSSTRDAGEIRTHDINLALQASRFPLAYRVFQLFRRFQRLLKSPASEPLGNLLDEVLQRNMNKSFFTPGGAERNRIAVQIQSL